MTGGSGTLDITRVNAKEIKLAYTFADEKKNIQISLPAANARGTQDAPAGLDGGGEEGNRCNRRYGICCKRNI